MQHNRYIDIRSGITMVVTDLHGDGAAFNRYIETFLALKKMGEADRIIFAGDVIHGYGHPDDDHSLHMVLRIMELQKEYGADSVIMLLGNHEMPHIYGVSLAKGNNEFTPRFEHSLGEYRPMVMTFFKKLPFVVRTVAGVSILHAGPDQSSINRLGRLRNFNHDSLLQDADATLAQQEDLNSVYDTYAQLSGHSYEDLARSYLAVTGPNDPRYPHLMRALFISERDQRFAVLWDFLFSQNERGMNEATYMQVCRQYLDALSAGAPSTQKVIVSGHIAVEGGFQILNDHHLRLASATHARPREAGCYLLFDAGKKVASAAALTPEVRGIF